MYGDCDRCKYKTSAEYLSVNLTEEELDTNMSWMNWSKNTDNQSEKMKFHGTVHEAITVLASKLPAFKIHFFVKNKQAKHFQDNHNKPCSSHHVNIQIDFSENASIMEQDEVQSAHWSHKQVTIFTAVAWMEEGTFSYCVPSDCLLHDKHAAVALLHVILNDLQSKLSIPITEVDIYSDGAAQHFKSKYMWMFITSLLEKGITVNWHYSATSHGKGAVDGIGGTVKRAVHSALMSRRYHVSNAREYADCARQVTQSVNILYVDSSYIDALKPELTEMWQSAITVKGTHGIHCVRSVAFGVVSVACYSQRQGELYYLLPQTIPQTPVTVDTSTDSDAEEESTDTQMPDDNSTEESPIGIGITAGHWYAIKWQPTAYWFIGRAVEKASHDEWTFSFIHQTSPNANMFRVVNDLEAVSVKDVFVEVESPAPSSSTRTQLLKLTASDFKTVLHKFQEI